MSAVRRRDFLQMLGYEVLGIMACSALSGCGSGEGDTNHVRMVTDLSDRFSAYGINDQGQIVGNAGPPGFQPLLWQNGKSVDINTFLPPGSGWQLEDVRGINNFGDIVGAGTYQGNPLHGFWLQRSTDRNTLVDLGDTFNVLGINQRGQVIGNVDGSFRGSVLWQNDRKVDLNTLLPSGSGWQLDAVLGINNRGDMVGYGTFQGDRFHAYLLQPQLYGKYIIQDLGNAFLPSGINDRRQIVGKSFLASGVPVLWLNGKILDINTLLPPNSGWQLHTADHINSRGDIIGSGTYHGDLLHEYLFQGAI